MSDDEALIVKSSPFLEFVYVDLTSHLHLAAFMPIKGRRGSDRSVALLLSRVAAFFVNVSIAVSPRVECVMMPEPHTIFGAMTHHSCR